MLAALFASRSAWWGTPCQMGGWKAWLVAARAETLGCR
jgi:hypothetical protein